MAFRRTCESLALLLWLVAAGCRYSVVADGTVEPLTLEQIVARAESVRGIRAGRPIDAREITRGHLGDPPHRPHGR